MIIRINIGHNYFWDVLWFKIFIICALSTASLQSSTDYSATVVELCRLAVESSQIINISNQRTSQKTLCIIVVSPPTFLNDIDQLNCIKYCNIIEMNDIYNSCFIYFESAFYKFQSSLFYNMP